MATLKKNFGWNLLLTFCNYLFPLITYPYISRVLGIDKIGACNFVDGIINYFILFSTLGLASYGVREIAKCRNDESRRNMVFSNLIVINFIGTIVSALVLIAITLWIPSLQEYRSFLWIGLIKLVFNMLLIEWFFQGLQEFRFITVRSILVRLFYVIAVFLFVKSKNNVTTYYGLTAAVVVANSLLNWYGSRKYRTLSLSNLHLKMFIVPVLVFGYYRLLTFMYTTFNPVFLGFATNDTEVGSFTTATKIYSILMGVFTAFTTVMVPKVSELLAEHKQQQLQEMADKTFSLLFCLSLPVIILCQFNAEGIIYLIAGSGYEGAYTPFKIVIFMLLVIGMEQICIQQFLMASSSTRAIFQVSSVGAVMGVVMNICLTPSMGAVGSALSWGLSEVAVLSVGFYHVRHIMHLHINIRVLVIDLLWSTLYVVPLVVIRHLLPVGSTWSLILSCSIIAILFLLINIKLNKNDIIVAMLSKLVVKR